MSQDYRVFAGKLSGSGYVQTKPKQAREVVIACEVWDFVRREWRTHFVPCRDHRQALATLKSWGVTEFQDLVNPEALKKADKAHLLDRSILY